MIRIIGIGQSLRGDDRVGQAAVRLWEKTYPETVQQPNIFVDVVENPGIGLLNLIEGADSAILVDAVQSGAAPGSIYQLREKELAAFLAGADSAHGWGVAETLALGRKIDSENMPKKIDLIGIEIAQVKLGENLSVEVEASLSEAVRLIEEIIEASIS